MDDEGLKRFYVSFGGLLIEYGICTGGGTYWVAEERDDKD